jgi:aminoglycoside 6'-N-acetyltransferase
VLRSDRVTLRPMTEADADRLQALATEPTIRPWLAAGDTEEGLRKVMLTEGRSFAVEVDGALAGWLGTHEEDDPDYRAVALDILLGPAFQDRGIGPEALRTAIRWFIEERGHHRFTIDPAVDNERAIRAYARVGFRPVGVMRRYERRDGWGDNLLMDLLAEELVGR